MTDQQALDQIAIPAKTYRQALTEVLTDDWNLRKKVLHAKPGDVLDVRVVYDAQISMDLAKQLLADLPPMA